MTKARMALAELAEKGADADFLREMIQYVAQRLMEMDVETLCGAASGERHASMTPARPAVFRELRDRLDLDLRHLAGTCLDDCDWDLGTVLLEQGRHTELLTEDADRHRSISAPGRGARRARECMGVR